jgi:hypothetical protein
VRLEKDEFLAARKKAAAEKVSDRFAQMRALGGAAVEVEHLTGSVGWDLFLRYVQSGLEAAQRGMAAIDEQILAPETVSADQIALLKIRREYQRGIRDILKQVVELPKRITDDSDAAKKWIADQEDAA